MNCVSALSTDCESGLHSLTSVDYRAAECKGTRSTKVYYMQQLTRLHSNPQVCYPNLMILRSVVKLRRIGGSHVITILKDVRDALDLRDNDRVMITVEDHKMIVTKEEDGLAA